MLSSSNKWGVKKCRSPPEVVSDGTCKTNIQTHLQIDTVSLLKNPDSGRLAYVFSIDASISEKNECKYFRKTYPNKHTSCQTCRLASAWVKSRWSSKSRWSLLIRRKQTFTSLCGDDNDASSSPLGHGGPASRTSEEEAEWLVGRGLALQVEGAQWYR